MTVSPKSGSSGTCSRTSSSRDSSPRSASRAMAKAVNCFEVDPMLERVSAVKGTPCVRLAIPYAFSNTTSPPWTTATTAPGESSRSADAISWSTIPSGVVAMGSTRARVRVYRPAPSSNGVTVIR